MTKFNRSSSSPFSVPLVETFPVPAYRPTSDTLQSTYEKTNSLEPSPSAEIMTRSVGPPFLSAAPSRPGEVLGNRASLYFHELTQLEPTMTFSAYMDMNYQGYKTIFNADRWNEIRNEGNKFHVVDRRGI